MCFQTTTETLGNLYAISKSEKRLNGLAWADIAKMEEFADIDVTQLFSKKSYRGMLLKTRVNKRNLIKL